MHFFRKTNIDFIGKRRTYYIVSIAITVAGILFALIRGVEYGIDFAGGTEVQFQFKQNVKIEDVRSALDKEAFRGAEVKYYGKDESGILIRVPGGSQGVKAGSETTRKLLEAMDKGFPNNPRELRQEQHIGPKIGAELQQKALLAIFFTCVVIMLYLAFRFRFVYGFGAVVAIIHDVLVAFAFAVICNRTFPWLNLEMNSTMLAAFLTIVGFSVNDTVIIFDRIREDQKKYKGQTLKEIMNRAINETMPRTIITSGTVFLTLVVLFIWGGEVLRGFAFTMLVGVVTGTYSSIFVASAIAYDWMHRGMTEDQIEGVAPRATGNVKKREKIAATA